MRGTELTRQLNTENMMSTFKEDGAGSIAWYLYMIKNMPNQSGVNYLTTYKGVDWVTARQAMTDLINAGYVESFGKVGGSRLNHRLTSFGHRYLEEHKQEVGGEVINPTEPSELRGKKQTVAETPKFDAPTLAPKPVDRPIVKPVAAAPVEPAVQAQPARTLMKPVYEVSPTGVAKEMQPTPSNAEKVGKALQELTESDSFEAKFKELLSEILVERFADQVTAKDILDVMDRGKPGNVEQARNREVTLDSVVQDIVKLKALDPELKIGFSARDDGGVK
jgi:hypothetical protein